MKWSIFPVFLIIFSLVVPAYAMCPGIMTPPSFMVMPDDNTQGLIVYSHTDKLETLVLEPSFHGDAIDFGMVLPLPNKPEITEADEEVFNELKMITEQSMLRPHFLGESTSASSGSGVDIIEIKDVGDYTATVLTAESSSALISWLDENGYTFSQKDAVNFEYYVDKTGYYFVVLKVNMDEANVDENGNLNGKLKPIEFTFVSEEPMLPFRIMAVDMEEMSFTLYTLSEFAYFVPGIDVGYMKKLPEIMDVESLERYAPDDKWLLRMEVNFDPMMVEKNLILTKAGNPPREFEGEVLTINSDSFSSESGLIQGTAPGNMDVDDFASLSPLKQQKTGILIESVDCKDDFALMISGNSERSVCVTDEHTSAFSDRGWTESTIRINELLRIA